MRIVNPEGKQNHSIGEGTWVVYGWSKDGSAVYGLRFDQNRRQIVGRIDISTGKESTITDLGPVPAAFDFFGSVMNDFFYRGFSLHPDGKSFLMSVMRARAQIYLMTDFDRGRRLFDRFWKRP